MLRVTSESLTEMEKARRDDVWGIESKWRVDADAEWEDGDSCFGFIGDDDGHAYRYDIMAATLAALDDALATVRAGL